ncbi:MAG: DUF5667 domain-containing protein [Candidatus Levybacteria bacterium]|nr:DUF5667 domain-containing protein [Candidatus Levybacteria bacterium]
MDTFPTQDTAQQVPVQQVSLEPEALNISSDQQQPPQEKRSLRRFLNISTWIILFAFLPITVLIFLSQDSVPGDLFYPVKRGLENVVLAAASVNPATRVAFRTNLTETRFKEAQSLVLSKSNASGLSTFVDEVQGAQLEVTNLTSDTERKTAEEKLISKIDEYQNGLSTLQAKTEQNVISYQFQETVLTPTPIPPSPTPTAIPSPTPRIVSSQSFPQPSSTPIPTITIVPTVVPITQATPSESTQVSEQKKIAETIKETKVTLDKIKKDLEENRSENRQKQEKRSESEKPNKGDLNKKTETPDRQK